MSVLNYFLRKVENQLRRRHLEKEKATIFSSNCIGGCICNDLGLRFDSPFVNLWVETPDYVKILEAPQDYLGKELVFLEQDEYPFPVARLKDAKLFFAHYHSNEEAMESWKRRCDRIDWDNVFVLMTDRDGCDDALLRRFDALPYKNKAVFTHKPRPDIVSAVYIPGFEQDGQVGDCVDFVNNWSGKRYYDYFDYVKWLNEG